ncbi:MAG: hypothetical protein U0270_17705 [Labilithrix sp.]
MRKHAELVRDVRRFNITNGGTVAKVDVFGQEIARRVNPCIRDETSLEVGDEERPCRPEVLDADVTTLNLRAVHEGHGVARIDREPRDLRVGAQLFLRLLRVFLVSAIGTAGDDDRNGQPYNERETTTACFSHG